MLKVASCTVGHMVVRSYGRKSKFFQLDGLLLFGIIMGLCSASSAIREYDFFIHNNSLSDEFLAI